MTAKQADVARGFGVEPPFPEDVTFPPPELFPKRPGCVLRQEGGRRLFDVMHWGVPLKMKGAKGQPITKQVSAFDPLRTLDSGRVLRQGDW
jgi:hypothetical protein